MTGRVFVLGEPGGLWPRTLRRIPEATVVDGGAELAHQLRSGRGPAWVLAAGALPHAQPHLPVAPRALVALGAVSVPDGTGWRRTSEWAALLTATGGDLSLAALEAIRPLASVAVDENMAHAWATALEQHPIFDALMLAAKSLRARVVRIPDLDVEVDERLRALQIITSLQQGGAERLVYELATALPAEGVAARICTVDRAQRQVLCTDTVDLSAQRRDPRALANAVVAEAVRWGADVLHAHLLAVGELRALSAHGIPLVTTVHNARAGWTEGTRELDPAAASLIVACTLAVEDELRTAGVTVPIRTIWNAIDERRVQTPPSTRAQVRARLELANEALVLIAIANPRPQKRLERLPAIVAELMRRGHDAHLLLVGDQGGCSPAAQASATLLAEALAAQSAEVRSRVRRLGPTADVGPLLAAADVAVSTSWFEGLSLAQLEARAVSVPVCTTDVGGASELAIGDAGVRLLPVDAGNGAFADAILALPAAPRPTLPRRRFSIAGAATRHGVLYRSLLKAPGTRDARVVLVANNLSIGGAQSSARRLLLGLAARGVPVEAVVLEEDPLLPTPGRRALESASIRVRALPPSWSPPQAVDELTRILRQKPPRALLFWNAISEHKVRLADALLDSVPIIDVSPGEMYFSSLERCLAGLRMRPDVPLRDERDYGRHLRAVVVKYAQERARAARLGAPVHVIPNGVPIPDRAARGSGGARLVFGTAARLAPHKRLELLLDAVRLAAPRLPPYELRIAGGCERGGESYAQELAKRAQGLSVRWLGSLDCIDRFLDELDVFVMVSEPAGCPNASLEAMAAGLPLIVTDHGGAAEQITSDVGLVTAREDVAQLAEALVALAHDGDRRRLLGVSARARAVANFSVDRMVSDYLALIEACFAPPGK